jgi:Zn-dependent protease
VSGPWSPPPPQPGPRRRVDPRWLTVIVIGIIALIVLDRRGAIHIQEIYVLYFAAVIPSVILHEISHGWVALAFGDDTAKRSGRLTLNPISHISVLGTLIVPALLVLAGYPAFGWAKPVPVNISRLRHPRNQAVVVSLAGPLLNIGLAVIFGLLFRFLVPMAIQNNISYYGLGSGFGEPVWAQYLFVLGYANVVLAVFNLIPIPPLDGSSVLERFIPRSLLPGYLSIRPYTIFLPFALLWLRPNWWVEIYTPFLNLWAHVL